MNPDERANALRCTACDGIHGTGMGLVTVMTVLPLLLSRLGAGKIELGLLSSIAAAGFVLGQPFGMFLIGRRRRGKRFFIRWVLSLWVPTHLAMAAAVYFLSTDHAPTCRAAMLLLVAVVVCGDSMAIPTWIDWQASLFSQRSRGRAIGLIAGAWALGAGLGSLAAGKVQASFAFPLNYTLLFLGAGLLFATSLNFLRRVREPASVTAPRAPVQTADLVRFLGQSLRGVNYRSYLFSRILLALGGGAAGFYAVHFLSEDGGAVAAGAVIALGALQAFTQAVSSYALGRVGDRLGHKMGVAVGCAAQLGAIATAYVGSGPLACAACFALLGVAWGAGWVSHVNMLLETCPHDSRMAHFVLSNTVLAPFLAAVPLATGWMMEQVGVRAGIGITIIPTALGVAWLALAVKEPRSAQAAASEPDMPRPG